MKGRFHERCHVSEDVPRLDACHLRCHPSLEPSLKSLAFFPRLVEFAVHVAYAFLSISFCALHTPTPCRLFRCPACHASTLICHQPIAPG